MPIIPTQAHQPATPSPVNIGISNRSFDGLVDIGNGRHIHMTCRGYGSPTVLLEAGAGNNAQIWEQIALPDDSSSEAVLPAVATFTRVCAYDRPGTLLDDTHHSRSDPVTGPRSAADMVADLHALIENAQLERPLVLAGHSFCGLIVRLYAETWPDDVAGLVLIDAAHQDYYAALQALLTPEQWAAANELPGREDYPELESIDVVASAAQVIAAEETNPLRQMPVVVLTHGQGFGFPPPYPAEEIEAAWSAAQEKLATLVPGTHFIVATESGHYIQIDQPELVVDAIRTVVDAVRDPASWATPDSTP
jgi:pimeloyl-ACP methyl ester carboxylesterase